MRARCVDATARLERHAKERAQEHKIRSTDYKTKNNLYV